MSMNRSKFNVSVTPFLLAITLAPFAQALAQNDALPLKPVQAIRPVATAVTADRVEVHAQREGEEGKADLKVNTTRIGKGLMELRDIPQSLTVITERLLDDRNLETLKEALKQSAGVSFQAAEGSEEDIRIRGFSLQSTGDIFIDGMRDPAFYERDSFNWDRLEVLRGSASMLFGRGSTGGAVNQVSKIPLSFSRRSADLTVGSGNYRRLTADINLVTARDQALRLNVMRTLGDRDGLKTDKAGAALSYALGIGTANEWILNAYALDNDNGIHYGLPWLTPGIVKGGNRLWPTNPKNYYGASSDLNQTGTRQASVLHIHRMDGGAEWRSALRIAQYNRDQRASAIRFAAANLQPDGSNVSADNFSSATVLTRGNNVKIMDMKNAYFQSDYSANQSWWGLKHKVQAGVDLAVEDFEARNASAAAAKPTTRVGTPNDGLGLDEASRVLSPARRFDAKALGAYAQNLLSLSQDWKLLGGLRFDQFDGDYRNLTPATGNAASNPCTVKPNENIGRNDALWSKRGGLLYQPNDHSSWHLSYGTSFNTSGDTYQYDAGNVNTPPESSRNIELGGKFEHFEGRLSTRFALFHTTKYNERNRDADTVNACNYVLSGKRHAAGLEFDAAGRISERWELYFSYAFIPQAKVDESSGAQGTEPVGSRPGLTPRHSASLWSTYKVTSDLRLGGGLTYRSSDRPVGLAATSPIEAPEFTTADAMAEYSSGNWIYKINLINLADRHYADLLYRGHYVPGKPRTIQFSASFNF